MKSQLSTTIIIMLCLAATSFARPPLLPISQKAFGDKNGLPYTDLDHHPTSLRNLSIGMFDCGTAGVTMLERMLQLDQFETPTGKEQPDDIHDIQNGNINDYVARDAKKVEVEKQKISPPFSAWTLFVDGGIIAILLLVGKLVRVKIRWVQRLFIPPSLIAGFLALALGPNGLDWLPLSDNTGTYASILIACIFGCLPFASVSSKQVNRQVAHMWVYSQGGMLAQWTLGCVMGLLVFKLLWPQLNSAFGLAMPAGFCGGHGTAAALGAAFQTYNYEDMLTLAMTAATVGIISSVIVGLFIVKRGTQKGHTTFLESFSHLPHEYQVGLLPTEKRTSLGTATTSSISIDSLTFHFSVVMAVTLGGYGLSKFVQLFVPTLSLPVFSCAFIVGIAVASLFHRTGVSHYICSHTVGHLSGTFTDILVVCGIASIRLSVVVQNLIPLLILLILGLACTALYVFTIARRMLTCYWFEKAMFTWGWFTGTMAMGIALLRVVDPEQRTHCLEDYALAYLFIAPVEICLVTFAPLAFMNGIGWLFTAICATALFIVFLIGKRIIKYPNIQVS